MPHRHLLRLLSVLRRWFCCCWFFVYSFLFAPIACGGSVFCPCFVMQYFVSFLVLQSSWRGKERWLLYFYFLPGVSWLLVFCGSFSRCHGWYAVCYCGIACIPYSLIFFCVIYHIFNTFNVMAAVKTCRTRMANEILLHPKSWPLQHIKHMANTTCVVPSPTGPMGWALPSILAQSAKSEFKSSK